MVDWGEHGALPAKIWGFVDLTNVGLDTKKVGYGGLADMPPAVCAVVESTKYSGNAFDRSVSDIFTPIKTIVQAKGPKGIVTKYKYYLADVDAFVKPLIVIPDTGGDSNDFFEVAPRAGWREFFIEWLEAPHDDDAISDYEEEITSSSDDSDE